ncbi:right-handed parallel beta-helix repeat-containing protein [Roseomonas sp. USHLN139]|uniref:right-handed parallel beta-helix repeat-containing protein n=1 Tax=Roseomonas sp. USHLN139 TaxID=3081298 RepID=UPI003B02BAEC
MRLPVRLLALSATALLFGLPGADAQPRAPAAACGQADLEVRQSMQLDPACRYTGMVTVTGSNLVLDCRGAVLDGEGKVRRTLRVGGTVGVANVEIRNCVVTGSRSHGLEVGWGEADGRKPRGADGRTLYDGHPHDIRLTGLTVRRNGRVGIYLDDHVQNVTLADSRIEENGGVGIYVTNGLRNSRIAGNRITGNGRGREGGVPHADAGTREGIALDGAIDNVIEDNLLQDNAAGGIFLYRNCGEHPEDPATDAPRLAPSRNILRNNTIEGGFVGIWVASRQERQYRPGECRLVPDAAAGVFTDAAPGNQILGNTLRQVGTGIRVADDSNIIRGNRILAVRTCLLLGSESRSRLGHPVQGLTVEDNQCLRGELTTVPQTAVRAARNSMAR